MATEAEHHVGGVAHGRDIGTNVDRVGNEQCRDQHHHKPARQHFAHILGKAGAGNAADMCTHQLHRRHQRIGQDHRPEQMEAKLSTRLRIGGNPARIVVGRACDQPWSELCKQCNRTQARAEFECFPHNSARLGARKWPFA